MNDKKTIIFDTDAGSDCDDMMALSYLIYAERNLGVNIAAVTHCLASDDGVPALRATFRYFGEDIPPHGHMEGGPILQDYYCKSLAQEYAYEADRDKSESAVRVLRRALSNAEDKVKIIAVGQYTNIAALIESEPDDISSTYGRDLLRSKCEGIFLMGASFVKEDGKEMAEWNIKWNIPAARAVFSLADVPIYILPFETGIDALTGSGIQKKYGKNNPLSRSFALFPGDVSGGRHSWDPMTALFAVEGTSDMFSLSDLGKVTVTDEGYTRFSPTPCGNIRIISVKCESDMGARECKQKIAEYIDRCVDTLFDFQTRN